VSHLAGLFDELKSMLAENEHRRNAVIGKAESSSSTSEGTVMVLISLQYKVINSPFLEQMFYKQTGIFLRSKITTLR